MYKFFDRLQNLVSGLGTDKDKRMANAFLLNLISPDELASMHRSDWLARKIVDIIPHDMMRAWRNWQADDDQIEAIEAEEKRLGVRAKVTDAMKKARLFGGSVIIIGAPGNASEELNPEQVGQGQLEYLTVLHRHELAEEEIIGNVLSPYYREPTFYTVRGRGDIQARVHPSRVVRFCGEPILDTTRATDSWGDSVLQIVYDAVQNAASSIEHVASLIPESKVDVIKVPQLSDHLSSAQGTTALTSRFTYAAQMKSQFNMLLLEGDGDSGEVWEQKSIAFAQFPELLRLFLQVASGAADIPVTRLLGESPAGMLSTGKGEERNYYDNLSSRQEIELRPALARVLDEVLIRSATGERDSDIYYEFAPLWQLTEKERAEVDKMNAEIAEIDVRVGLLPIPVLAKARANRVIEDGVYPGIEAAIAEFGQDIGEAAIEVQQAEQELAIAAQEARQQQMQATDAAPRTLYVRRNVKNAAAIIAWAKDQGFTTTLPAAEMHVTIAFSRQPMDWMKVPSDWSFGSKEGTITIPAGGPRIVEPLGDKGAVVLLFNSSDLSWRHMTIREAGASWDYENYQPHITITYDAGGVDLKEIEPYRGPIFLGPEIFEEVNDDWTGT